MFNFLNNKKQSYKEVKKQNEVLNKTISALLTNERFSNDGTTYFDSLFNSNAVSEYNTKQLQVDQIRKKYKGEGKHGNILLQRIINLRTAFTMPNRLFLIRNPQFEGSDKVVKEVKAFLYDFLNINNLDAYGPRDLTVESEKTGEILLEHTWDAINKNVALNYYAWDSPGYKIEPKDNNNKYKLNKKYKAEVSFEDKYLKIPDEKLSYIQFNEDANAIGGYPTCGPILHIIDDLEKDFKDWRCLNHLFAHPTPHFKCETSEDANAIMTLITQIGWRVGTAIATNSDFILKGPTGVEATMLMNSITTAAKLLSGHTGIGIHFFGFANVMSNRATADSMGEPTEVVLHSEMTSWKGFYNDMFKKAIATRNTLLAKTLPENAVQVKVIPITDRQYNVIKEIYMPLLENNNISRHTLFDNIPELDAANEEDRIKEQEEMTKKEQSNKPGFTMPISSNVNNDDDNSDNDNDNNNNIEDNDKDIIEIKKENIN
jgi:hypothetical protein